MADTQARVNQTVSWSPASTADTITCSDIAPQVRSGVQIEADGFNLETATITATAKSGATKSVTVEAGSGEIIVVGEGFSLTKIQISGITGGPYNVRFSQ